MLKTSRGLFENLIKIVTSVSQKHTHPFPMLHTLGELPNFLVLSAG